MRKVWRIRFCIFNYDKKFLTARPYLGLKNLLINHGFPVTLPESNVFMFYAVALRILHRYRG